MGAFFIGKPHIFGGERDGTAMCETAAASGAINGVAFAEVSLRDAKFRPHISCAGCIEKNLDFKVLPLPPKYNCSE